MKPNAGYSTRFIMNTNDDFDNTPNNDILNKDTPVPADKEIDSNLNLSVGQMLKHLREQKSLKIEKVADNLRLDNSTVENLEQDNYKQLPPAIFVQGYIRSYAKFLDTDPEQLIRQYYQQEGNAPDLQYAAPQGIRGSAEQSALGERSKKKTPATESLGKLLLAVLIVASAMYLWQQDYLNKDLLKFLQSTKNEGNINVITDPGLVPPNLSNNDEAPQPIMPPNINNMEGSYTPPQEEDDNNSENDSPESENDNQDQTTLTTETTTSTTETTNTPTETTNTASSDNTEARHSNETPTLAETNTTETETAVVVEAPKLPVDKLQISFTGASWTEIYDATGKRLYYRTSVSGSSKNFTGTPPFKLKMGKPEVTQVIYLGEEMNLSRYHGRVTTIKIGEPQ